MKKTINKLSLNKMTISNLNESEMHQRVGGKKSDYFCGSPTSLTSCNVSNCSTRRNCPVVVK
ncbi:MAG: class I lanthipeptide [Bacteroidetes bacterium]|jgi:natural product precursor|nr:class I lanthipeptide [Bacteroidota bacterium]MBK9318581.1 class I lanthipeptide [Bacteroidota bacterium]